MGSTTPWTSYRTPVLAPLGPIDPTPSIDAPRPERPRSADDLGPAASRTYCPAGRRARPPSSNRPAPDATATEVGNLAVVPHERTLGRTGGADSYRVGAAR